MAISPWCLLLPSAFSLLQLDNQTFTENYFEINRKLKMDLFSKYDRQLPGLYLSQRSNIEPQIMQTNCSLMYTKILEIDQAKQSATMILDFYNKWVDPRLTWNASDYNGITSISVVRKDTVWIPDVLPYDMHSYIDSLPDDIQFVDIYSDGLVGLYRTTVIDFVCRLNLSSFPFDTQTCELKITSFNFPISEMIVDGTVDDYLKETVATAGNGEWTMEKIWVENDILVGEFQRRYSLLRFKFQMKRSTTYYTVLMIIPSFILTLLCVFGLFWEPVTHENYIDSLNLGFAAILAMMFVLQMTTQDMPKVNYADCLSIYLLVNLLLITVASIIVMLLGKVKKKSRKEINLGLWKIPKCLIHGHHLLLLLAFSTAALTNFLVLVAG